MFSDDTKIAIGQRIRDIRLKLNQTQAEFSEGMNISVNFLSDIENGKKGFSCETLYNACEHYKLSADYIFFGKTETENRSRTIIETASKMNSSELKATIDYLESLKKFKESIKH